MNNSTAPISPPTSEVSFTDMLAKFDDARDEMLPGLPVDAHFDQFPKEKIEAYVNLVLCGIGTNSEKYNLAPPRNYEEAYRGHSQCFTDIDSALIFSGQFPWMDSYDIYTTYSLRKCHTGSLHVHLNFVVCICKLNFNQIWPLILISAI